MSQSGCCASLHLEREWVTGSPADGGRMFPGEPLPGQRPHPPSPLLSVRVWSVLRIMPEMLLTLGTPLAAPGTPGIPGPPRESLSQEDPEFCSPSLCGAVRVQRRRQRL